MTRTVLLGDIARVRRGSSPRPIQAFIQDKPGIPWVKIADATAANSRFIEHTNEYIKEEGRKNSVFVTPGTLIMSNSATPGLPMIMQINACVHDGWLILDELKDVDRNWLYYYLLNRRAQSAREASGSVFSNLKTDIVKSFRFNLPTIDEQKKIAEILWAIDDKIELNRKMNETLELIGQAFFSHYFIDNPEAKTWPAKIFADYADVVTGKGSVKTQLSEIGTIPLYGANGVMGTSKDYLYDEKLVITGRVGTLGAVRAVTGKAWYSDNVLIMKPKNNNFGFVYHVAKSFDYNSLNRGSTQPLVTQTDLKKQPVKDPDSQTLAQFEKHYTLIFQKLLINNQEIETLTTLRNSLLPRLISGKIVL